ncbi:hypothetical protein [Kribbella sp. NPDC050470]|uniref:hypothetical protein n=1 Tax=unclassified Kribbella TaxID=2644121 RepID=UPI00379D4A0F
MAEVAGGKGVVMSRKAFVEELGRLGNVHPSLLWEERVVALAPEVSDFVVTVDQPLTVIVSVRDGFEGARVIVDEFVFEYVPAVELHDFLSAVLSGAREVHRGRMVVRSGEQPWES